MGIQLSKRMSALASLVTEGSRLADIGTDHGYIPIALVQKGRIPSALAMDVGKGPLSRAREHIHSQGLDTYIETRLSDGLTELHEGEADTVLIAGMGGMLMKRILEGGGHCLSSVGELILQPQSEIHLVRKFLAEHGYQITDEDIVLEDGKYYPMMRAELIHDFEDRSGQCKDHPWKTFQYFYGDVEEQRSPEVLRNFLIHEQEKSSTIMERLHENGREVSDRMKELQEQMNLIRETLEALDGR